MSKQQGLAVRENDAPLAPASDAASIIGVIERAVSNPNIDVEKMERLLAMQERVMDRQAKAAFMAALADMQTELPEIEERGKIKIGTSKPQGYALWEDINKIIKPIMQKHGFALSFRTGMGDGKISVTGVLSHREGHSEETTIHLPADDSGSKNKVQAVGSSTSYGKRYTASALLNLTSRGEDDDGTAAGARTITPEQAEELHKLIKLYDAVEEKVAGFAKVGTVEEIPAKDFDRVKSALNDWARKQREGK